jgi:hypothetical protein
VSLRAAIAEPNARVPSMLGVLTCPPIGSSINARGCQGSGLKLRVNTVLLDRNGQFFAKLKRKKIFSNKLLQSYFNS